MVQSAFYVAIVICSCIAVEVIELVPLVCVCVCMSITWPRIYSQGTYTTAQSLCLNLASFKRISVSAPNITHSREPGGEIIKLPSMKNNV